MRHFTQEDVGKDVIDRNGEPLGRVAGVEDGQARLEPETGLESRMEAAASPESDALAVSPEQVEEVTEDWVRVHLEG